MYESYYGLTSKPFQLNPDPNFYFGSKQHRRAQAYLEYGMHQNEGFIVITGEVGAGKTTIVRGLLEGLDAEKVVAAVRSARMVDHAYVISFHRDAVKLWLGRAPRGSMLGAASGGRAMGRMAERVEAARACWNAGDLPGYLTLYDASVRVHGFAPQPLPNF